MSHTTDFDLKPGDDFRELLVVIKDEELIRLRYRLYKRNNERLVDILTEEIQKREEAWLKEKS
jgi:hypothetical protein